MSEITARSSEAVELNHNQVEKSTYKINNIGGSIFYKGFKRLFDISVSLIGLIISIFICIPVIIAIKIESPGPVIFKQKRLGKNGKEFTIYKFRSMVQNAEAKTGAIWARRNDSRVTNVGKFIRKTRIDEIPQLWNILKGEMSLIGPRPERPVFTKEFEENHPGFKNRLLVKPGVTGLAQVNGGYDIKPHQKLRLDLLYIEKRNIWLDIKIVFKTILVIFFGHGAR